MTTPGPGPVPLLPPPPEVPKRDAGILGHIEDLISGHLRPELADLRIKLANAETREAKALAWVAAHRAALERLAALGVKLAGELSPAGAEAAQALAGEAEAIAAAAAELAGDAGSQM